METYDFPDSLLAHADKITLKELLDASFSQAWIVSCMSNALHYARIQSNEEFMDDDVALVARLDRILRSIPRDERDSLYRECSSMVYAFKEENRKRAQEFAHRTQASN